MIFLQAASFLFNEDRGIFVTGKFGLYNVLIILPLNIILT